jgi:hypothetical protein
MRPPPRDGRSSIAGRTELAENVEQAKAIVVAEFHEVACLSRWVGPKSPVSGSRLRVQRPGRRCGLGRYP